MTEPYLMHIWTDRIDETDILCLRRALEADIFGHGLEEILQSVHEFSMQLWRGEVEGKRFIMLTQTYEHPGGRELKIWSVGGRGYIGAIDTAYAVLSDYARANGCRWLTGISKQKALNRLYKRFTNLTTYKQWIVEFEHVSGS